MNLAAVFALDAMLVRSAVLEVIAQIAVEALTQVRTRQNACCARRVLGAALSEQMTLRRAKTVQSEDIRLPLEFQNSQGVINAVLEGFRAKMERLRHAPNAPEGTSRMKLGLIPVSASPTGPS